MSDQAPNLQAVIDWVQANRPDCIGYVQDIANPGGTPSQQRDALLLLITFGFQAGRQYQINHPEQGVHSYHSEPEWLQRPPVKTEKP